MTFYHGLGMFLFNMVALLVGAIIAYYIINKVEQEKKRKELMEHLKGKKDWEKQVYYILTPLQRQDTITYFYEKIQYTN